jgi:CheY-like chemotaxis protein
LEKEPFTIRQLMEECRNTFLVACQDKGVSLNVDSPLEGAYPVLGDITVLKQILYNLLGNAVKFTQQGSISITAEPYVAEEIDPNPNLGIMFTVADTGKGISADAIGTLFDPFTQEDNGITRSFGGSGLGLNIAQKLAQLMGGEISCNSIVGQGSIFEVIVYLEQQPGSFERLDVDHSDRFEVPPLKLLIVDDVPLNLMVAAALLKPKGHIIETAANGHKALEMASNNDYDAILMDVHMPGMDGMEATRRIRNGANKQRAAVPILALTADVDVRQKALFMASGMDATVGKPWELKVLEKELKCLLKLG